MKTQFRTAIILCALAACMACGTVQASAITGPFSFYFDENGTGHFILSDGSNVPTSGFSQLDPNTGHLALTYALPNVIGPGIVDVLDPSGALSDAISFYKSGGFGFMAYYSILPGTDLADTISGGFVPLSDFSVTEVGNMFAFYSGGAPGVNNDYFGTSGAASAPDGGSTLALLGGTFALVGAFSRKLRK